MVKNTPIYHITHINNIETILKDGMLWSDAKRTKLGYIPENIAYEHIKKRRFSTPVKIGIQGVLADYVPFYFCNRSPMLNAIRKGGVTGSQDTQPNIIYLVSSVEKIANEGSNLSWCFTDGHGVDQLTDYYNTPKDLINIDWGIIADWDYRDTLADNDRTRRKQAEFLVHESFPVGLIEKIGVYGIEQKQSVETILAKHPHKIPVIVEKKWYYSSRGET
ncbi:MAG TPA: DUF4433 domain-containing protein [Gammaproteobacteria bacterium]|nr:DUF4433 domain-containing protein [Gammaproteobacteria bacterium]